MKKLLGVLTMIIVASCHPVSASAGSTIAVSYTHLTLPTKA